MVLHFIPDQDDPAGTIRHLLGGIRCTSYLVVGHAVSDTHPGGSGKRREPAQREIAHAGTAPLARGGRAPLLRAGAELLAPGLVTLSGRWPEDGTVPPGLTGTSASAGAARKTPPGAAFSQRPYPPGSPSGCSMTPSVGNLNGEPAGPVPDRRPGVQCLPRASGDRLP